PARRDENLGDQQGQPGGDQQIGDRQGFHSRRSGVQGSEVGINARLSHIDCTDSRAISPDPDPRPPGPYTSFTTTRFPSISTTCTRPPAGMKLPSVTTSTYASPNWAIPAGRSVVAAVPTAPKRAAISPLPLVVRSASASASIFSAGGSRTRRFA